MAKDDEDQLNVNKSLAKDDEDQLNVNKSLARDGKDPDFINDKGYEKLEEELFKNSANKVEHCLEYLSMDCFDVINLFGIFLKEPAT
jgi:hypothetical protein